MRIFRIILLSTSVILFFLSFFLYFSTNKEEIQYEKKQEKLEEKAVEIIAPKEEVKEENTEEIIEPKTEETLKINWEYLQSVNSDIIGWIYIPNTNVNYPLLKGIDNQYYERRMFDKSQSLFGSIYIDYRNEGVGYEKNTIIYGHNTLNNTMFADVTKYINTEFMNAHPSIFIYTPSKTYKADVFLAYEQNYNDEVYKINIEEMLEYINKTGSPEHKLSYAKKQGYIIGENDRIITLSTCSFRTTVKKPNERFIIQAKIVEE